MSWTEFKEPIPTKAASVPGINIQSDGQVYLNPEFRRQYGVTVENSYALFHDVKAGKVGLVFNKGPYRIRLAKNVSLGGYRVLLKHLGWKAKGFFALEPVQTEHGRMFVATFMAYKESNLEAAVTELLAMPEPAYPEPSPQVTTEVLHPLVATSLAQNHGAEPEPTTDGADIADEDPGVDLTPVQKSQAMYYHVDEGHSLEQIARHCGRSVLRVRAYLTDERIEEYTRCKGPGSRRQWREQELRRLKGGTGGK